MSINVVTISGNLTRDPDYRETPSGLGVMNFTVAVNDRRKNQQTGEWEDYANFIDCTMFGKRAQSLSERLHKGSAVAVQGKLNHRRYETKDGQKRSKIEVSVNELMFADAGKPKQQDGNGYASDDLPF